MEETKTLEPRVRSVPIEALDRRYQALRLPATPARRAALDASLERHGQQQPVLASDGIESEKLVLLDGFKRVELLLARGAERVWVAVVRLDGPSSLAAIAAANAGRCGLSDLEEAWIIASLQREHGLSQVDIAHLLSRHASWVSRRLSLLQRLERAVQDDVRLGLISTSAAREVARLPRGTQTAAAQAVISHGLSCQMVSRLVSVLRGADAETRHEVLRDPRAHVQAPPRQGASMAPDARLGRAGNGVREQLLRLHGAASRLEDTVVQSSPSSFTPREKDLLEALAVPVAEKTRTALDKLLASIATAAEEPSRAR